HFRLFTNSLGGGAAWAGYYFPHDEFYDAATRRTMEQIARIAASGATVASETPTLYEYYGQQTGRADLRFVLLSDKGQVSSLAAGDIIVAARGRRYFSNSAYLEYLSKIPTAADIDLNGIPAVSVYILDEASAATMRNLAAR